MGTGVGPPPGGGRSGGDTAALADWAIWRAAHAVHAGRDGPGADRGGAAAGGGLPEPPPSDSLPTWSRAVVLLAPNLIAGAFPLLLALVSPTSRCLGLGLILLFLALLMGGQVPAPPDHGKKYA